MSGVAQPVEGQEGRVEGAGPGGHVGRLTPGCLLSTLLYPALPTLRSPFARPLRSRFGVTAVDTMLLVCVVLPLAVLVMGIGPRILRLAYEMVSVLVSWPMM